MLDLDREHTDVPPGHEECRVLGRSSVLNSKSSSLRMSFEMSVNNNLRVLSMGREWTAAGLECELRELHQVGETRLMDTLRGCLVLHKLGRMTKMKKVIKAFPSV